MQASDSSEFSVDRFYPDAAWEAKSVECREVQSHNPLAKSPNFILVKPIEVRDGVEVMQVPSWIPERETPRLTLYSF